MCVCSKVQPYFLRQHLRHVGVRFHLKNYNDYISCCSQGDLRNFASTCPRFFSMQT